MKLKQVEKSHQLIIGHLGPRLVEQTKAWVDPPDACVTNFRRLSGEECYLGMIRLFGTAMHVHAVRVRRKADGTIVGVKDPHNLLEDAYQASGDCQPLATTTIPGLPGEYVVWAFPFGD